MGSDIGGMVLTGIVPGPDMGGMASAGVVLGSIIYGIV